jgi:hypothetical protein
MTATEIVHLILSSGIGVGIFLTILKVGKIFEKIDSMASDLKDIKSDISDVKVRLGRLEQKNEDDFQSEVKLLLREKK